MALGKAGWKNFFRGVDLELSKLSKIFWTMTRGKEHQVRWVCHNGRWGLTDLLPPAGSQRVSYLSCIHRIPDRSRFWKNLHSLLADGGRVLVFTQGCQVTYPIPPRLAGCVPDAPSVETLLREMNLSGLSSCCAKVHLVKRSVAKTLWAQWLMKGCFSDMDYCDRAEIENFCQTLPDVVEITMSYYILVGIKLGPQSGMIDIRPSCVHGLCGCARVALQEDWVLLSVPIRVAGQSEGGRSREWHRRGGKIGMHLCSTAYRLFNHSLQPNCRLTQKGLIKTNRFIEAGEELSLDYSANPAAD